MHDFFFFITSSLVGSTRQVLWQLFVCNLKYANPPAGEL